MADENYKVVFDGSPVEGITIDVMKHNLIEHFKLSDERQSRIFSGKRVTLRQKLDYEAALKYQEALAQLGAKASVEPMQEISLESLSLAPKEEEEQQDEEYNPNMAPPSPSLSGQDPTDPRRQTADQFVTCPKCGTEQINSDQCIRCDIIFDRYFEVQAKLETGQGPDQILPKHLGLRRQKTMDNRVGWIRMPGVKTLIISAFFLTCLFFAAKNTRVWQSYDVQDTLKIEAQQRCADDTACEFEVRTQMDQCMGQIDLSPYLDARTERKQQALKQISNELAQCFVDEDGKRLF